MAKRKIEERNISTLEELVYNSLHYIGFTKATKDNAALLLRLIFSGIGRHFFYEPDTNFRLGFINIEKSPNLDELFNVKIIRNSEKKIINAETLWKYYTGEMLREEQLKEVLDNFVKELLLYSQAQETKIAKIANDINMKKEKKNGI